MTKAIMVQGTMSNVGKSILAAALCRIFRQDGYCAAPFKSQNMALNSYITKEGLEMGRAQVIQAQAAGIEPSVCMNPILLKPSSDTGSQVIVNGKVMGNYSAAEYFKMKHSLVPQIMKAYNRLADQYDVIVLEGAGSPAEINLKKDDIVNMGMAKLANAPVLLVGDIDRGGVFASLTGTLMLLDPDERAMVKGLIINKFRGDKAILKPGLDMISNITGKPVLGVVPYQHLDIDDEDSLSDRLENEAPAGAIDIAVIRLPRLSNFTDFNALSAINGVSVRYVKSVSALKTPDLIILPGTKNTMEDLLWLRQCGLESAIQKFVSSGGAVFGICGGFQMLGETLCDPQQVEHGGQMNGMGLLPIKTIFEKQKVRTQVTGWFVKLDGVLAGLSNVPIEGYEIHMGRTESSSKVANLLTEDGLSKPDGAFCGNVYGSYVHGIFDRPECAKALVIALCKAKGIDWSQVEAFDRSAHQEQQYDSLAKAVRESLDMEKIYKILEAGI